MRKTGIVTIATVVVIGGALGWLLEVALVAAGRATLVPPITFAAVLLVLAVAVLAIAVPVRRVAKGRRDAQGQSATVDPFYATRVLALAKSAVWVGALLAGGTLAVLVFVFTRPVVGDGSILPTILGFAASAGLLAAGIVAEEWCRIPPGEDDEHPDGGEPAPLHGSHR